MVTVAHHFMALGEKNVTGQVQNSQSIRVICAEIVKNFM